MSAELYDMLVTNGGSVLKWLCDKCQLSMTMGVAGGSSSTPDGKIDQLLTLVQRLMDTFQHINARFDEKTDATVTAQIDTRLKSVEEGLMQMECRLAKNEDRCISSEAKLSQGDQVTDRPLTGDSADSDRAVVNADLQEAVRRRLDEDRDVESRLSNIIIHRVPEDRKASPEVRRASDFTYVTEMCGEVFDVSIGKEDIVKQFRLGSFPADDTTRPLLISFKDVEQKNAIMYDVKKLKKSSDRFRNASIAHDLTPRQREVLHELLDEAGEENRALSDGDKGNFKFIVVGAHKKPKIIKIRC